jgi:hypothetical protein
VYNPSNTFVNLLSDFFVAALGMPGEKARPLGFLRWYGEGHAAATAFRENKSHFVMINGQKIDISDLLLKEGVGESTLVNDLSGRKINPYLKQFLPEEEVKDKGLLSRTGDALTQYRQHVELAPRIAAGLEALERTGSVEEFGRIARNITLNFGPGAPKMTKVPILRFMAPFITFQSLATKRILELATTPGSRARTAVALAAVPTAIWMWNTQNKEYEAVNNSLSLKDKSSLRVIIPSWSNPAEPMRDVSGNPVVIRVKYFVPEVVAQFVGLGNLPQRISRVVEGRDTLQDFAGDVVKGPTEQAWGKTLTTVPSIWNELITGRNSLNGKDMTLRERAEKLMPILKIPFSIASAAKNQGIEDTETTVKKVTGEALSQFTGTTPMYSYTVTGHVFDADLKSALSNFNLARRDWELKATSDNREEKVKAAHAYIAAQKKLREMIAIFKKDRGEEKAEQELRHLARNLRDWDPEKRDEYIRRQIADTKDVMRSELNM